MTGENAQYLQVFLDESKENVQVLNTICLKLEQGGNDDDFATMFRAAHTLKGMSATMGYTQMAHLTHRLEDALGVLRENPALIRTEFIDAFFSAIDVLESMLGEIQQTGSEGENDLTSLVALLNQIGAAETEVAVTVSADPESVSLHGIHVTDEVRHILLNCKMNGQICGFLRVCFTDDCMMKGPRSIMVVRTIDAFADLIQCNPTTDEIESGSFDGDVIFLVVLRENNEQGLIDGVQSISEISGVVWTPFDENAGTGNGGQLETQSSESEDASAPQTSAASSNSGKANATPSSRTASKALEQTIRVPVERLDVLMNLLSELVIDKTRLAAMASEIGRPELKEVTDKLSRISTDLQSSVMSLRMVPVESLFQRFPRMIRDLSKSLNKDIQLKMSGLETEFDRTLIDEMGEALVHLIRNAADHGLETTEDRLAAGKSAQGTISLSAYAAGQHVFIEVQDDGGGIHTQKVRDRAISKGLISSAQADGMSEAQIHNLLFESGFSTAQTVSDISGRGVGLDAVKQKVESLGGRIQIESAIGAGSTFRIQLPLTLSILQALLVRIAGDTFAIPLSNVEEVISPKASDVKQVHGQRVLSYRDKLVPILDSGNWLYNRACLDESPWSLVVCKSGSQRLAIAVHGLIGQQEIVNKSLGAYLRNVRWFSGATILGNGQIALIVDVHTWMELGRS